MSATRTKRRQVTFASVLAAFALATTSGTAQAVSCKSGAKAAADLWQEYDVIAKQVGCAAGTAAAAVASAGATLPKSVQIYKQCFKQADKADKTTRKAIRQWNDLNKNGWGTVGPRRLALGKRHAGTIRGSFTRMFITESPLKQDRLSLTITKERFRGKTDVVVCSYLPGDDQGTQIDHFTIGKGLGNKGKAWLNEYDGLEGRIVSVFLNGKSVAKSMKYTLWADTSPAPDQGGNRASSGGSSAPAGNGGGGQTVGSDRPTGNASGSRGNVVGALPDGGQLAGVKPNLNPEVAERIGNMGSQGSSGTDGNLAAQLAGRWDTQHGELRLKQVGEFVVGDYADRGVLLGRAKGGCVAGIFTNGGRNGVFRFSMKGENRFEGQWAWHGQQPNKSWNGRRTGPEPDAFRNFTRGDRAIRSTANQRSVFDGIYDSNHGRLALWARDLFLVGDYADKGMLIGMWDGNSFVGRFTNGGRTGWFDLAFLSKTGSFRDGQWGWLDSGQGGNWRLNEVRDNAGPGDLTLPAPRCR